MDLKTNVFVGARCFLVCVLMGLSSVTCESDVATDNVLNGNDTENKTGEGGEHGIEVATVNYHAVRDPLVFTIIVILAAISKVAFHYTNFLSSKVPESCLLIIMGLIFGAIIEYSGAAAHLPEFFKPHEFFQFLLPPIILEAAYSLHDRTFAQNVGSVILFAFVGTILAFFTIGFTLYGLVISGAMGSFPFELTLTQVLIFGSLIVAVDPVAVLAVFQEIGVNDMLYFLVFGESLLNDGVTVVLYQVMQSYNQMASDNMDIDGRQIGLGIVKFIVVCMGGLIIGIFFGGLTAFTTKFTRHVKVIQPILIYSMAYLGFLMAEVFEFSGIISIIGCGLTQVQYAFHNISDKAKTTITYFTKVISTINEIIIFLFLGLAMVRMRTHYWHTGFVLWSLLFCLVYRFIITFFLSFLLNTFDKTRYRKIGYDEQFMIAYGGLRGAVCFGLVAMLSEQHLPGKDMFETTTLVVIFFTVFVQGITIKPLVKVLRIQLAPPKTISLNWDLHDKMTDHLMAGVEEIVGLHGEYSFIEKFRNFEDHYIKNWLQIEPDTSHTQLQEFYHKIILKEHFKHLRIAGAKVDPGQTHIPRIETSMYLLKEEDTAPVPHGHIPEPEAKQKRVCDAIHIDVSGLRNILKTGHGTCGACPLHQKHDKNLTAEHNVNMANLIHNKTQTNRRIEKLRQSSKKGEHDEEEKTERKREGKKRVTISETINGSDDLPVRDTGSNSQDFDNPIFEDDRFVVHF